MDQKKLLGLLSAAVKFKASDIHLQPHLPPAFRVHGDLIDVKHAPLGDADIQAIFHAVVRDTQAKEKIGDIKEIDGSFEVKGLCRFRYNFFRNRGRLAAILRLVPTQIPTIESLGLPPVLHKIAELHRGLILVTGATGSGKSSTLAAIVDHINTHHPYHVVTIEDPIEFTHQHKKARITQRELGRDTDTFANALRAALRQDPDVILVGEMRDPETIDIALKAAETGHLVLSTVHTTDAIKTINRLVAVFPTDTQDFVRIRLSENLVATISQRLIRRADGAGMTAAQEIMISNRAIQDCIAKADRTGEINDYIARSADISGGQTFDQHLADLYRASMISLETAMEASTNPGDFQRNLIYSTTKADPTRVMDGPPEEKVQLDYSQEDHSKSQSSIPETGTRSVKKTHVA
jgi:twitching motility protein PilT